MKLTTRRKFRLRRLQRKIYENLCKNLVGKPVEFAVCYDKTGKIVEEVLERYGHLIDPVTVEVNVDIL